MAINLGKLDGVHEIYRRELENWQGSDDEEGDSQSDDEQSNTDDEEDGGILLESEAQPIPDISLEADLEQSEATMVDTRPQPRPFETLRGFFARTSTTWQDIVLDNIRHGDPVDKSVKELRKIAFDMSEAKWWDSREEVTALEKEQEEAGIGDVIDLADRNNETGGAGRRR